MDMVINSWLPELAGLVISRGLIWLLKERPRASFFLRSWGPRPCNLSEAVFATCREIPTVNEDNTQENAKRMISNDIVEAWAEVSFNLGTADILVLLTFGAG